MIKNLLRNIMGGGASNKDVRFLFVSGCGRSGTTLIARILASHPSIVLGSERYMKLYARKFSMFRPDLFEKDRFFSFREADSGHFSKELSVATRKYYEDMSEKWDSRLYVGDKIPTIFENFERIRKRFVRVKFVHITRNIDDVLNSWEARAMLGTLPSGYNYKMAVEVWNTALSNAMTYHQKYPNEIYLINYENIFHSGNICKLFSAIDSSLDCGHVESALGKLKVRAEELNKAREGRNISAEQRQYVEKYARLDLYEEYKHASIF